jgi:gluconolactonase
MWQPAQRYPDPAVHVLDPRFARYVIFNAAIERLATGCRWSEGPVWFGDMRTLVWSDIPNDRMLRWDEATGQVTAFRAPSGHANGNTRDRQGRLVTCEHGGRRVTRTEHDGTLTVLCAGHDGKPLNSPNDVVVKRDGSVWFTDPPFGILGHYEGHAAAAALPTNVYRIDPASGDVTVVCGDIDRPNGLCFSPDESLLYIVQSGGDRHIHVFDVDGHVLANRRAFVTCASGEAPDGIRCDVDGNLWCGWGTGPGHDGVRVFAPDGTAIGHIDLPERCANVCFGGVARNRLFMAASQSLYAVYTATQGAAPG